jgi:hypothetical protein
MEAEFPGNLPLLSRVAKDKYFPGTYYIELFNLAILEADLSRICPA